VGKGNLYGREYLRLSALQQKSPDKFGSLVTSTLKERWNIGALVGMAYAELGDRKKAQDTFQEAMDWAPEPFLVSRAAGIFYYNKGLLPEARHYLLKADKLNGTDPTVRQVLDEIAQKVEYRGKEPTISCCMIVKTKRPSWSSASRASRTMSTRSSSSIPGLRTKQSTSQGNTLTRSTSTPGKGVSARQGTRRLSTRPATGYSR